LVNSRLSSDKRVARVEHEPKMKRPLLTIENAGRFCIILALCAVAAMFSYVVWMALGN
jgi:hypothetical protein